MNTSTDANTNGRPARHEQLLGMLDQVRSIADHLNDITNTLGVKQATTDPSSKACPSPSDSIPQPVQQDNLVSVLEMLPASMSSEVDAIHRTLCDIKNALE